MIKFVQRMMPAINDSLLNRKEENKLSSMKHLIKICRIESISIISLLKLNKLKRCLVGI